MSFNSGAAYHNLNISDVTFEDEVIVKDRPTRSYLLKIILLIITAIIVTFVTVSTAVETAIIRQAQYKTADVAVLDPDRSKPLQALRYESCGRSPAEARLRGCNFDISSFAWLTSECYDDSLAQEFISWSNWTWYTSEEPDDNTQVSFEEARLGEKDTYVDWNYHMVHCTFMWRQQHQATENGWIGRHLVNYEHTKHCQHSLLMNTYENRNVRTPAVIMYPHCLRVGIGEGMYPGPTRRER